MGRGRWLFGIAPIVLGWSAPAPAAAPVTRIEWDAPASCPDASVVSDRLAALRDGAVDTRGLGTVRGVVRRDRSGYELTLELIDEGERRSRLITADACEDLAEAAAVAIVLAHDARAAEAAAGRRAPNGPAPGAPLGAAAATVEADVPPSSRGPTPALQLAAYGLLDTAALPAPAFGAGAELRLGFGRLGLGAYGAWLPARAHYVRDQSFVELGAWFAGVRACQRLFEVGLAAALCAGFEAGMSSAAGTGLARSREVTDPWLAPNLAFELGARLWRQVGLTARAEVAAPLVRRPYVVNEVDAVHRVPALVPRVWLGLTWALD